MAIRRLLKNQMKLATSGHVQTLRSGHGWDRPDVPLELNPLYVHKRELSIFDSNMWVYDQVFPEYIISYNEIHLKDQWNAIKETVSQSGYIAAILLMIGVFYYGNAAPRQQGIETNGANRAYGEYFNQYTKRHGYRSNFLGLSVNSNNSNIFPNYEKTDGMRDVIEQDISSVGNRQKINSEAKNFILKIQKNCEQRVQSRQTATTTTHAHAH